MENKIPAPFRLSPEVGKALSQRLPLVALESTVITHGLPFPENRNLGLDMESVVRSHGANPATIAVIDGRIQVGISTEQLNNLAQGKNLHKLSVRDLGPAVALKWTGGTTVASTILAANAAGIRVMATGGIGGVHRVPPGDGGPRRAPYLAADISADLIQLAHTPVIVVCAGAKAILDLPATLEYLETHSVPVVGYQTDEFPAFYSRSSGLPVSARVASPDEIVKLAKAHWSLGNRSAVLVVVPPPEETALPYERVEEAVNQALDEAARQQVRGQAVTPFLLERMVALTGGASLQANLALLRNNAAVASEIAKDLSQRERMMSA